MNVYRKIATLDFHFLFSYHWSGRISFRFYVLWLLTNTLIVSGEASVPLHLQLAEQLQNEVLPEHNTYSASPTKIVFASDKGATFSENHSVCSTLVVALFRRAYSWDAEAMRRWYGETWPEANDIFRVMMGKNGFDPVLTIGALLPGDIITIDYHSQVPPTGHVILVQALPVKITASAPIIPDTQQYALTIIDSSSSPHGGDDTRRLADGREIGGIGRGKMRLYVDAQGAVVGYTRSVTAGSHYYSQTERPLIMARLRAGWKP